MSGIDRRAFLGGLLALGLGAGAAPRGAAAFGSHAVFDLPLLRYESPSWNARPSALRRMLLEIDLRTNIRVGDGERIVAPRTEDLFATPMLVVGGADGFAPWSEEARGALRRFINAGGLVLVDSSDGREESAFDESIRREFAEILPGSRFSRMPEDHVIRQTFYLMEGAPGRLQFRDHFELLESDGRVAVFYSRNDLMGAWARDRFGNFEHTVMGGERRREMAYRLGVNLAMYALTLDYKEDQVHIPHILRRRRWRVD